jgi:hypothetical protein
MESQGLLPCSKEPATGSSPEQYHYQSQACNSQALAKRWFLVIFIKPHHVEAMMAALKKMDTNYADIP